MTRILSSVLLTILILAAYTFIPFETRAYEVERRVEKVFVDNSYIQRYSGRFGRWVSPGRSLESYANDFQTTVDEIRRINHFEVDTGGFVFIPMSDDYYRGLLDEGRGRRILQIDPRKLLWPVEDPYYTSRYGKRFHRLHQGLDIGCAVNTIVVAAEAGVIKRRGRYGAMGKAITIQHDNGLETWYAHNNIILVNEGDRVAKGQIISYSGNTGRTTGPHLHFEVRYLNVAMNPEDFLPYGLTNPDLVFREGLRNADEATVEKSSGQESALVSPGVVVERRELN